MFLIDTHSHLYEPEFDADREQALARAVECGVRRLLLPAIDAQSHERMFDLCRRHPDRCIPMLGLHPTSINDNPNWHEELDGVERLLKNPPEGIRRFCAVGEIGIDFYWSAEFREQQIEALRRQFRLALDCGLPVAVHTRSAWPEMIALVEEFRGSGLRGVFHAFGENAATYERLKSCGDFLFGIGGVVTFKKSRLADTVREMDLADLVLETDCPYLTPTPHRGERNESAYIVHICEKIAGIKGLAPQAVAAATTANAERMFNLH